MRRWRAAHAHFTPPSRIDLAEWIEGNVVLPEGMTETSGLVTLWPYQRGICDAISDPEVERITVVKSARLGYTTLLTGVVASYVANDPAQILVVLPAENDCRDYMVSEVEPVFAASPALRGKLSDDADPNKRSTILSRRFPGGSVKFVGATAPRNLRRHNARVLLIDEAAAMGADSKAGSVVARAIGRTRGFASRKIIVGSTPLDEHSNVLIDYEQNNRARFEVPCRSAAASPSSNGSTSDGATTRARRTSGARIARRRSPKPASLRWSHKAVGSPAAPRCATTPAS